MKAAPNEESQLRTTVLELEEMLREKDAQVEQMTADMSTVNEMVVTLSDERKRLQNTMSALEAQMREHDRKIQSLELAQSGLFWDLLSGYRRAKNSWLPPGTTRRKWYDKQLSAFKAILRGHGNANGHEFKKPEPIPPEVLPEIVGQVEPLAEAVAVNPPESKAPPISSKSLRVTADGLAVVEPREDYISYRLAEIPDVFSFFNGIFDGHINLMNIDVTDNCNLRCPFCISDFTKATSTRMSEDVFDKVLKLLPMVPDQSFFLSCAFEPFLHPRFIELVKRIPGDQRNKGFFTTNLTIPLSATVFEELSVANINHINISLDSLDPATFEQLRRRGKFAVFQKQLESLVSVFRNATKPPKLRYITMAFKQNFHEISELVRTTHQDYLAYEHEIRMPFEYTQMDPEWKSAALLSPEEWSDLERMIPELGYRVKLMNPCYPPYSERTYNA